MLNFKNCPICDRKTGVESLRCECGYDFVCVEETVKAEVKAKPKKAAK